MSRRCSNEGIIQRAIFQHLRARAVPGVIAWHTPNGGYRKPIEAAILKGQGVRPGVSDVLALHDGKFFALELKADDGRPTESQLQFIADVNAAGGFATWVAGFDRALSVLEAWGLLRGRAATG